MRWMVLLIGLGLSGCIGEPPPKTAIAHYDECSAAGGGFVRMAACGKERRTDYCAQMKVCSADGDAVVAYADSLSASVSRHEMTEPEAQRRWIEFRSSQLSAMRQLEAQRRASQGVTCVTTGAVTNCN